MSADVEREQRVIDLLNQRLDRPSRSPVEWIVDRVWRFFCSVRAALYEIAFLAFLVLIGTLKGSIIPAQLPRLLPALDPLVQRWYAFDVFHSLVFTLTLALLGIAIVVCTINRVPGIWHAISRPTIVTSSSFFDRADMAAESYVAASPSTAVVDLGAVLKRRRYRVLTETRGEQIHLYADRHRFGRLGTFPFHLALILIVIGGIVGSEYGFREQLFDIPEGSSRSVGHGTGLRVELVRFVDNYSEIGAPTSFRSDLILYDGARIVKRQSIEVNHPLSYRNATFYQSSFGPAADIRVKDEAGNLIFDDGVSFLYLSKSNASAPAALVELPTHGVRFELIYPNTTLNAVPEIGETKLLPGEMFVQAREWSTNALISPGLIVGQGETVAFGGLQFEFVRERRFTVLQVAYNPGIPFLFAAAVLVVGGLLVTFGLPHRRIRAIASPSADGTLLVIAPMARRDWSGKRHFLQTLRIAEPRLGPFHPMEKQTDVQR